MYLKNLVAETRSGSRSQLRSEHQVQIFPDFISNDHGFLDLPKEII